MFAFFTNDCRISAFSNHSWSWHVSRLWRKMGNMADMVEANDKHILSICRFKTSISSIWSVVQRISMADQYSHGKHCLAGIADWSGGQMHWVQLIQSFSNSAQCQGVASKPLLNAWFFRLSLISVCIYQHNINLICVGEPHKESDQIERSGHSSHFEPSCTTYIYHYEQIVLSPAYFSPITQGGNLQTTAISHFASSTTRNWKLSMLRLNKNVLEIPVFCQCDANGSYPVVTVSLCSQHLALYPVLAVLWATSSLTHKYGQISWLLQALLLTMHNQSSVRCIPFGNSKLNAKLQ